jgi:hypothetical protein
MHGYTPFSMAKGLGEFSGAFTCWILPGAQEKLKTDFMGMLSKILCT